MVLVLMSFGFIYAEEEKTSENPPIPTCYSIRCYKCDEVHKKYPGYTNNGSIAERRFECEIGKKNTFVYKCKYGHVLYINTETGERN